MVDGDEPRKWAARLAAPVAFFAAVTVLVVLVQRGLNAGQSAPTLTTPVATTPSATEPGTTTKRRKKRFYKVRTGDTLESIAAKFDTTTDHLLELNPDLDPLALQPGERIRVA